MIPVSPSAFLPFSENSTSTDTRFYSALGIDMWQLLPFSRGSVKIKVGSHFFSRRDTCSFVNVVY
jgi:hypothetical protein